MAKFFLLIGTLNAGLCVVLGAFAAHKLKEILSVASLNTFQTGVQYHFYHSLGLILLSLLILQLGDANKSLVYSGYVFILGILLFSGSLYGLSFQLGTWLGPITPIGGLCFIAAWLLMAWGGYKSF